MKNMELLFKNLKTYLNSNIEIHKYLSHISIIAPPVDLNSNIEIHKWKY